MTGDQDPKLAVNPMGVACMQRNHDHDDRKLPCQNSLQGERSDMEISEREEAEISKENDDPFYQSEGA